MEFLTAKEVAKLLHYKKPDKVYLLVRSHILKGFKRGRIWLIDKDSFLQWCRNQMGDL